MNFLSQVLPYCPIHFLMLLQQRESLESCPLNNCAKMVTASPFVCHFNSCSGQAGFNQFLNLISSHKQEYNALMIYVQSSLCLGC